MSKKAMRLIRNSQEQFEGNPLQTKTNTTRMRVVITLSVSIVTNKISDYHLHHEGQWLAAITPWLTSSAYNGGHR
jgi:hypothetical protein